jgi:uncharacterized zinc-type alcohol dehydrogenase-like protein
MAWINVSSCSRAWNCGRVLVGDNVSSYKAGDLVGVGCLVDSCQTCSPCQQDLEQFCEAGATFTYNSPDKHIEGKQTTEVPTSVVVDEKFVPENIDEASAALHYVQESQLVTIVTGK